MAFDEVARHDLHSRLRDALGEQAAATLMEHLLPPWDEVATRAELRAEIVGLRVEMRQGFADLNAELVAEMSSNTRTMVFALIASNLTLAAISFAAAALR